MFNQYPYENLQDLNLDFILRRIREIGDIVATFVSVESVTFADPIQWDITKNYAKNTVVLDSDGNAFLAKKPVPVNIMLNNGEYWLEIFNFTEYIRTFDSNLTFNIERDTFRATNVYAPDDWLLLNDVLYKVIEIIHVDDIFITTDEDPDAANIERFTVEEFCRDWADYMVHTINQYKNDIDASELAYKNQLQGLYTTFTTNITNTVNQYKNDIDASELAYRNQLALDIANTTASLQAQLDAAITGVTVDSEVINARIGADGVTYSTLGEAIRAQCAYLYAFDYVLTSIKNARNNQIVFDVDKLPINRTGGYYMTDGTWVANASFEVRELPIIDGFNYFISSNGTNTPLGINGLVKKSDGTNALFGLNTTDANAYLLGTDYIGGKILINRAAAQGFKYITMTLYSSDDITYHKDYVVNAYIADSALTVTDARKYKAVKVPINKSFDYFVNPEYYATPAGFMFDENDVSLGTLYVNANTHRLIISQNCAYIILNMLYNDSITVKRNFYFTTKCKKPFNFDNKNSLWFGDSITQNVYTLPDGTEQYDDTKTYRALFTRAFNMYGGNFAQGGTSFAYDYTSSVENPHGSIVYAIEQHGTPNPNIDYAFIAGGTNDYGYGVPIGDYESTDNTTFYGALNELATFLNAEYNGIEIFILSPIDRVTAGNAIEPLDAYRQALYTWAMANNYNFVDMSGAFPSEYVYLYNTFLGDGLHPTENGHKLMCDILRSKIC